MQRREYRGKDSKSKTQVLDAVDHECLFGSEQEFGETHILGCFPKNDEFGLCDRHALSLQ